VKVKDNADVGTVEEKVLHPLERNNRIAAGIYLVAQAASIVLFAIFVRPQPTLTVIDNGLFEAVGAALLVLVGM
jgi:hypothetical protein